MRPLPLALLVTAALLFAGCTTSDDPGAPAPGPGGEAAAARNETTSIPISVQAAASEPTGTASRNGAAGQVEVGANATGLVVEAEWSCTSPTCGFDLVVLDANETEVGRASGSGDARVEVGNLTEGAYLVRLVYGSPAVANAEGEILATVFYGAPPPEGFTAFEGEAAARRAGP